MDKLKELLGDLYEQVMVKLGTTKVIVDDGTFIPKHRFDEVISEKKLAIEQVKKYEDDLKSLKEKAVGNDLLTAQISELQKSNKTLKEEFDAKLQQDRKSTALLVALMDSGVSDPAARDLLAKGIDSSKVELDETGKVKGIDSILKPIKENKAFSGMFGQTVISGQEHQTGGNPTPKSELETQLEEATKSGRLVEVIALKRKILAQQ